MFAWFMTKPKEDTMAMSLKYDQISPMQAAFDRLQAINAELDQKLQNAMLQANGWAGLANQRLSMLETSDAAHKSQIEAYKYKLEATEKQVNAWRNDAIEQAMRVQGLVKERDQALDDAADMASRVQELEDGADPLTRDMAAEIEDLKEQLDSTVSMDAFKRLREQLFAADARVQELEDQGHAATIACRAKYVQGLEEKLAQANEACKLYAAGASRVESSKQQLLAEAAQDEITINQLREERDQAKKQLIELEREVAGARKVPANWSEYVTNLEYALDQSKRNEKTARRGEDFNAKAVHDLIDQNLQFEKKVEVLEAVKDRLQDEHARLMGELNKAKADNQAYFTQVIEANEFNRRLLRESEDRGIAIEGLREALEKAKATIESERQHHQNLNRDLIAWHESDQATIKRQVSRINQLFDEKLATPDERMLKQELVDLRTNVTQAIESIQSQIREAVDMVELAGIKSTDASDHLVEAEHMLDELQESIGNT